MTFFKKLLSYMLLLIVLGFGATFCAINLDHVYVNIPWLGEFKTPGAIVYVACFLGGSFASTLYFGLEHFKMAWQMRKLQKRLKRLESQEEAELHLTDQPPPLARSQPPLTEAEAATTKS